MKTVRRGLLLGVFTLVIAACGASADDTTTTSTPATPATTTTSTLATTTLPPTTTTTQPPIGATSTIIVVQQDLTALGYFDGTIDGIPGEQTRAAIAKFQAEKDLDSDGEFGPNTDAALFPLLQANKDYVTDVQETLIELEFYGGPVDGDYGKGTRAAIELLQKSCDLDQTGDLDIQTRLCLGGHL